MQICARKYKKKKRIDDDLKSDSDSSEGKKYDTDERDE